MATEKRLIDMEDALRRMEKAEHLMHNINGIKAVDIGAVRQFFGMLKPVDAAEVVHGHWTYTEVEYEIYMICSECGWDSDFRTNYCPNCGADMRERKDND